MQKRLSFDMSVEDHKYLKMCCAKIGMSIKEFIIKATNEKVYEYEDKWFKELEKNDGIDHKKDVYKIEV